MYQISVIAVEYFTYKTNTKIVLQFVYKLNNPSIVFCSRYTDIIDRDNYQKYGIFKKGSYNSTEFLRDQSKLQINNIFDLTPKPENVMTGCRMRENDYTLQSKDNCYSIFNVTKYLESEFICYQFRTKIIDSKFRCDQAAFSYRFMNQLYRISLHSRFQLSNYIKLISFIPRDVNDSVLILPYLSRGFYNTIVRYGHDAPETSRIYWIAVSGNSYFVLRLQSPYDTHCVKNRKEADFYCNSRCNIAAFRRHGVFPTNEMITTPLPMKHLNDETLKNETLLRDIKARNDKCRMNCSKQQCDVWYSVTTTNTSPFKAHGLTITSTCSKKPAVIIQYFPRITFIEFVMYASSSLGIWFGVSFLAINPFQSSQKQVLKIIQLKPQNNVLRFLRHEIRGSSKNLEMVVQDLNKRVKQLEDNQLH